MEKTRKKIRIPRQDNYVALSDNTRVVPPSHVLAEIDFRRNSDREINFYQIVQNMRKREREELAAYEAELREADYKRRWKEEYELLKKWNLEQEERKRKRLQEELEETNKQRRAAAKEEEKKKNLLKEKNYQEWFKDVLQNPDNYSKETLLAVKRAQHSYDHPYDLLGRFDRWYARRLFDVKNALAATVLSSIDTNGSSISGNIDLSEYKLRLANNHDYVLQVRQSIKDLELQRNTMPSGPERDELDRNISNLYALLNRPETREMDDNYKQLYTIDKEGFWDTVLRAKRSFDYLIAYDQYKDYVAERNRQSDIDAYNRILVNDNALQGPVTPARQNQPITTGGAGYIPNAWGLLSTTDDDPNSYTQDLLLSIDVQKSQQYKRDIEEQRKQYVKDYIENRKHYMDAANDWKLAEYYKHGLAAYLDKPLWSPMYLFYELPQMIGSTYSSPNQAISTALTGISFAAYGSSVYTGPVGAGIGFLANLAASPYQIMSGFDENHAEINERRITNITDELKSPNVDRYEPIIKDLKERSKQYWLHHLTKLYKNKYPDKSDSEISKIVNYEINEYLDGEAGERHAISDYLMGITTNLVDEDGNGYVKSKSGQDLYTTENTDPALLHAQLYSTQGLLAQFLADNMRTVSGTIFEKAIELTPTGYLRRGASIVFDKAMSKTISRAASGIEKEAAEEIAKDAGRAIYRNGFRRASASELFAKGYARGAKIGEAAGFGLVGQVVGGTAGGVVNVAAKLGLSKLSPAARLMYISAEKAILNKYLHFYDKMLPTSKFGRAVAIYGGRVAKDTFASQMSEAAEEAVQYLNSKEDYAKKYGWGGMSLGDALINDIYQGARVFNSYMALLGLSNSELLDDAEYWANAKGGFALGGVHTGIMRLGIEGVSAYKELGVHSAILTSGVMNREADKYDRAANVEFARQAVLNKIPEVISTLHWMESNDSRREDPYFSQEDYDEKIKAATRINQLTNDKKVRAKLEAKGIAYGTEEYVNAIADLYNLESLSIQNIKERKERNNDILAFYNSKLYLDEADEILNEFLAGSIEATLGRQSAILEAGNEAVKQEIEAAKLAGTDTETLDFKKHLQIIRKDAQDNAAKNVDLNTRNNLLNISHAAHKVKSLIKLRQQYKTVEDFFGFISNKFGLNPKRPDAKLIVKSVDDQIKSAKDVLKEFDSDFDINLSDEATLEYINNLAIVHSNEEEIERAEIADAMLLADADVINKHIQMFEYGLHQKKDGSWEYNPTATKQETERKNKLAEDFESGVITTDQYFEQLTATPEYAPYEGEVSKNDYKNRINAIIEARKQNAALNAMYNDIVNGDGVVKIIEDSEQLELKENNTEQKKQQAKAEQEGFSFERTDTPKSNESKTQEIREKYKEKIDKAKAASKKRKKTLRDIRKGKYSMAAIVPIPTHLLEAANSLISTAQIGAYKFAEFVEGMREIAKTSGNNVNDFISGIKQFYLQERAKASVQNPNTLENYSTAQEVIDYNQDETVNTTTTNSVLQLQDEITENSSRINKEISTHFDTIINVGNTVEVYPNQHAYVNARYDSNVYFNEYVNRLNAANTSDESFRNELLKILDGRYEGFPVEEYVKHRTVQGIPEAAIANMLSWVPDYYVRNGKLMKRTVIAIMNGEDDQLNPEDYAGDFESFKQLVLDFKQKLIDLGLEILNTGQHLYGKNYYERNSSCDCDILATDGSRIYVIDIRYSFQNIRENWNTRYPRATMTVGQDITLRLRQIEQIINTTYNRAVNGLYCFPVVYNEEYDVLYADVDENNPWIVVKAESHDVLTEDLESLKDAANSTVEEINKNIDEYNGIIDEASKHGSNYVRIDRIDLLQFTTVEEYDNYLNNLHAQYDRLVDQIAQMRELIERSENLQNEVWELLFDESIYTESENSKALIDNLYDKCQQLDLLADRISSLKATTKEEKEEIDALVSLVFEAQTALDDVLQDQEASRTDVTAEELLIAAILDKMAENKDNFGKSAMFIRRWWVNNLVIGPSTNTFDNAVSINQMFFEFINRINSWNTSFREHVLNELEDNVPLQEWYSSVLNNYYSVLLNNAELFAKDNIEDGVQRLTIENAVKRGRQLIQEFNNVWDTRPEEGFDGPITSPADRINRMPVKWMDNYSISDSIMPSFNEMAESTIYYWLSNSPTFLDSKFVLSKNRRTGKLLIYIEGYTADGKKHDVTLSFENDVTKAKNQKDAERWQYVNNARLRFIRKALACIDFVKEHPEYEIVFDKFTNKGQIRYNEDGMLRNVSNFLFNGKENEHNLYTIQLSTKDRLGVLVTIHNKETGEFSYGIKGGYNLSDDIGGFDREYEKKKIKTQSGAIVYFYNTGGGQYIGTPIQSAAIGKDAGKLVDLMQKYIEGQRKDAQGFDIFELLRMRLYVLTPKDYVTQYNNINNAVYFDGLNIRIGRDSYNIYKDRDKLIQRIAGMGNVTRADMLNDYIRASQNPILSRVRSLLSQENQKILLSNGYTITLDDVVHHNTEPGSLDGSTWLGYMLRNNYLGSSAKAIGHKELRINHIGVRLKDSLGETTIKQELNEAKRQNRIIVEDDDFFDKLAGLKMSVEENSVDVTRGTEEQESFIESTLKYFDKVLGKNGKVEFGPTDKVFLGNASKTRRIIGVCTEEMVKLSRFAPESAAWHEAFHKIFELVIPSTERDAFYESYSHSLYGIITRPTDRDIAEAFADMFVSYMQNKQALDKADGFFKKIKPWIKTFALNLGMNFKIGRAKSKLMYELYRKMNAGEYRDATISKEQNERFLKLFGEGLYYTVTNTDSKVSADFSNIADVSDRDALVRGISYYILKLFGIDELDPKVGRVKISGGTKDTVATLDRLAKFNDGAVVDYLKNIDPAFEELFEHEEKEYKTKDGKIIKRNYYPKFEALSRYISDYISTLFNTMRKPKIEEDDTDPNSDNQVDDGDGVDFKSSDTDHWDKASYEFSKLESLTDRVKLFFGTIPYSKYSGEGQRKVVIDYTRNKFGCPEFMPIEEVWNMVVNKFHTASSIEELDKMMEDSLDINEMYARVYSKFHSLILGIYKYDEDGKIIVDETDYDKESFALQILSAIQSQKITFLVALSLKQKDGTEEGKSIRIVESSLDRDSRLFPDLWNRYLVSGQVGVFERERGESSLLDANGKPKKTKLIFRAGMGGKNGEDIFSRTANFFSTSKQELLSGKTDIVIDGVSYNTLAYEDVGRLKDEIIMRLNNIGIMFERGALDYMLADLYGGVDFEAVKRWLNDSPKSNDKQVLENAKMTSIQAFINRINSYVSNSGVIDQRLIEEKGYSDIGFVKLLAKYEGQYRRSRTLNMAYALNGKKLYSISLNNSISHIINALNTGDTDNEVINVLSGFGYNISTNDIGLPIGSIILKAIKNKQPLNIKGYTYIGFKTDNKGDSGSEYTDTATVEDYMGKLSMLQQGYLIFPTLADKGTYMIMDGIPIPGMKFTTVDKDGNMIVDNAPRMRVINNTAYLIPSDEVIDQMIEYAKVERLAILQCMANLGYKNIPGYEGGDEIVLSDEQKIENYHTYYTDKQGHRVEPNGTRFLSLTKIVSNEYNPKTGKYELVTHNLNDPRKSSTDLLKLANDYFFSRRAEETNEQMLERQRETMALTLAIQTNNEVKTAIDLGIVNRISYKFADGNREKVVSSNREDLINLNTLDLNVQQIKALHDHFMSTTKTSAGVLWKDIKNAAERQFYSKMAKSLAIAAILQDADIRHIICSLEVQRCFSGHPALFKVTYDYNKGKIKDSAFDIQKRIGGMVSTGEDNILNIPGIPKDYVCAECKDYKVKSKSDIAHRIKDMFVQGQVRYVYGVKTGNWDDAYSLPIEKLYEREDLKDSLNKAKELGEQFSKSFDGGINVADGASYITADMCKNMLRMRGAFDSKVKEAFDILTSADPYDWEKKKDAYKIVYDAVNIVPTKYTAYGFRPHTLNGNKVSNIAVAYYNKFALFPIFPCMATGKLELVYQKMLDEGVDNLLMTSAVKVGGQGAVEFDGEQISAPFNKYTQSYAYLRRQLNTDPEEGTETHLGTQMVKIGLQNLVLDRTYTDTNGNTRKGRDILTTFMTSINELAKIGETEVLDMFTDEVDGVRTINADKLSDYLKDLLTSRNANKTLIEAILVIEDKETGQRRLVCPIAATSDASWIESIFISTMNKKIVDIISPGKSFIQRSVFAMEGESKYAGKINNGNKLQMINEEHSMDCVISIDYFENILPKGLSFEEAKQWLIDQNVISGVRTGETEWHNAEALTIGYRIPTQAQSSIHALRVVDIIPAAKSTVILPEEFTKITGSDFDIDHLYLASYNLHAGEDGKLTNKYEYGSKEYYLNEILASIMTLLKDTESSLNFLYKSIDNDTDLVTDVSDYIQEEGSTKDEPYNFGTLHELVIRKNDYITGKKGIGPFALNVTNQVLTQLFGVKFAETEFTRRTRINSLDKLLDVNDNTIAAWLSAFINAHVDIVKDPYISRLNVNPFTYNMLNLLVRSGYGETALWFLANPLIRDMAAANDRANSQYMRRKSLNKKGKSTREEAILDAVKKYLSDDEISSEALKSLLTDKNRVEERIRIVNWIEENVETLKLAAITGKVDKDTAKQVFYAWKILEKYSLALGSLVLHTKVDTRKYGKNFIAVQKYYQEYNEIFRPVNGQTLWDTESIRALDEQSWIRTKTDIVATLPKMIFGGLTFNANPRFVNAVLKLAKRLEYDGRVLTSDDVVTLSRHVLTAIKSRYFVDYAREKLGMSDKDIAGLFIGNTSMNRQLVSLKNLIANDPQYSRLSTNSFLNQIYSMIEDKPVIANGRQMSDRPGFVTVLDNVDDSKVNSDLLSDGWLELMNDPNPRVRKFAKKFIVYAFLSSGEFKGWNKLLKYLPTEWILGKVDTDYQSYSDFIRDELNNVSDDYEYLYDDIVANNFMDYKFVKHMDAVNDDGSRNFMNNDRGVRIGMGVSYDQLENVPKYIAIAIPGRSRKNQDAYELYKMVDTVRSAREYHPVYVKIKKRGYHTRGNDIYEYGWNFNYAENERKGADTFDFEAAMYRVHEYIESRLLDDFSELQIRAVNKVYTVFEPKWEYMEDSWTTGLLDLRDEVQPQQVVGENISSKGSAFAKRLTNPFNNETVEFRGTKFDNAEHAYQTWKSGKFDQRGFDAHGGKVRGTTDYSSNYQTMVEIITAKLQQHPDLVQGITERGGMAYLNASTHNVTNDPFWETSGQNKFMEALKEAYNNVLQDVQEQKKIVSNLEDSLGGGEQATAEVQDAVKVAKKGMSFEEALAGLEAFFSKEEQAQIKQGLNGRNLQVMSVSRETDPAFFSKEIVSFLEKNAEKPLNDPTRVTVIEVWSKHDGLPIKDILDACKKYRVAPMVSFSITGLGGTALEGGVMKYQDMLEKIGELVKNGTLNPATTTVRIDPILPGITNMDDIRKVVETAKSFGIKKFVTSLMQSYGYTRNQWVYYGQGRKTYLSLDKTSDIQKLKALDTRIAGVAEIDDVLTPVDKEGKQVKVPNLYCNDRKVVQGIDKALASEGKSYDWNEYYGLKPDGKAEFKPKQKHIDEIGKVLLLLNEDPEITIQTCAFGIKGLKVSACLDPMIIERITGVDVLRKDGTYDRDTSRPECMCYGCHGDFFKGQNKKCYSSCAYCYAAHSGDNKLNYYNEDGTLKDNDYTRTERIQPQQQSNPNYVVTNEGIRIPMEKGTTIKLPSSLGGNTITIERIYEDPYEGTKFYGIQYDARGNRISDITEVITFYNETNGIRVFDANGNDITNANKLQEFDIQSLIGKDVYAYTKNREGYHEDELFGEVLSVRKIDGGYSMRVNLEGREYFINLTEDFLVANKESKFYEIGIMNNNNPVALKDFIEQLNSGQSNEFNSSEYGNGEEQNHCTH